MQLYRTRVALLKIFTVSELTSQIKGELESAFPLVKVEGEVSNLRLQSSGHLYFTLKDATAQIPVALFRGAGKNLSRPLKEGDQIVLTGELSVYPPKGAYQLIAREVEFAGLGKLLLLLQQRKEEMARRGWFAPERKKRLPMLPKRIGVVTSPTGAVIQDILQILDRRFRGVHLILNPVKVQGEGSAEEIALAIQEMNRYKLVDVLIIGRGGGSLEDLWAFNEECVVKAIVDSAIPIISAVGHETDVTLSDFAADVRAPTPSAAAELVIAEQEGQQNLCKKIGEQLSLSLRGKVEQRKRQIGTLQKHPAFASPYFLLGKQAQRLDELSGTLSHLTSRACERRRLQLNGASRHLLSVRPEVTLKAMRGKLSALASHLRSIDPKNLLAKGYLLLFEEKSNSVILSSHQLTEGERVRLQFQDGMATARIETIHGN